MSWVRLKQRKSYINVRRKSAVPSCLFMSIMENKKKTKWEVILATIDTFYRI
jgi:hypothetical protein